MERDFDPGYDRAPYRQLVADYPDESTYPIAEFRVDGDRSSTAAVSTERHGSW